MRKLKEMKHLAVTFVLAAGIAVLAAGCAKKSEPAGETAAAETTAAETEAAETTAAETEAETTAAATEAAEAAATLETAVQGDSLSVLTGVVMDAGMSTVTVSTSRYPDGITFLKEDAATGFAEGLLVDHEITVFYRGEIQDGDASSVTVELIRDAREGDAESGASMVSGTVVNIGMSVISIETEDGKTVSFEQDPKPVNMTEGPMEGDKVTIVYSYQDEAREGAVVPELIRKN